MQMIYCPNCGKIVGFKRALGFGTLFMVILTLGLWLLVIPLYPARCINCGLQRSSAFWKNLTTKPRRAITASSLTAAAVLVLLVLLLLLKLGPWHESPTSSSAVRTAASPVSEVVLNHPASGGASGIVPESKKIPQTPSSTSTETVADSFAESAQNQGFQTYTNARFGFSIDYPESFLAKRPPQNGDGITLISPDGGAVLVIAGGNNPGFGLKDYYERSLRSVRGDLGYRRMGGSWFVITWKEGGNLGYSKMFVGKGSQNSFTFTFPESRKPEYEQVVTIVEKSFRHGDVDHGQ